MSRLDPAVAAIRLAVRTALTDLPSSSLVLVACSGGADSLALAAATAFVAPRRGWRHGLITVDHQLQPGSDTRAAEVADWAKSLSFDPIEIATITVTGSDGPEAAARRGRYAALSATAHACGAACVLLGHTEDDQAETVLLALARGAGPRGVSGMPPVRSLSGVTFVRPLLGISRAITRRACVALGLSVWDDPHNADPAYTRARVRSSVLPALVSSLGPDVVPNLARTAALIAADSHLLDTLAAQALTACLVTGGLSIPALAALPGPLRARALHSWIASLGSPRGSLSHRHLAALDALVTNWHGQGPTNLPGGLTIHRTTTLLHPLLLSDAAAPTPTSDAAPTPSSGAILEDFGDLATPKTQDLAE